jgi:Domain of unknown function (DUF5597)
MLPIWKAAAPSIDILAPDIYLPDYARYNKVLDLYGTSNNALMVPETGDRPDFAPFFFNAIGQGTIEWAPFGVDHADAAQIKAQDAVNSEETLMQQFRYNLTVLRPMDRLIARLNFEGKVKGAAEDEAVHSERLGFSNWTVVVSYDLPRFGMGKAPQGNQPPRGQALIAQIGPDEFLVTAFDARVDFEPTDKSEGQQRQFLAVEEGSYVGGAWRRDRILNGDETDYGLNFSTATELLRVTLSTY